MKKQKVTTDMLDKVEGEVRLQGEADFASGPEPYYLTTTLETPSQLFLMRIRDET